jgi:hypothetical protein
LLVAACSLEGAMDRMVSAGDRAFAERFVADVRAGHAERLKPEFDPELWAKSGEQLVAARALFPRGEGRTRLIGYNISANYANGASSTTRNYVLVTTDERHWTRTEILTLSEGGPARVVRWNVNGSDTPPPELQFLDMWERIVPWVQGGIAIVLIAFIALIWWLVRRSRRRRAGAPLP